jgi:arylsulfatase A-like enzyme
MPLAKSSIRAHPLRTLVKRPLHLVVPTLILAALAGAWLWDLAGRAVPLNVVVITLDTTRADRLSVYGYMDASMPALERLAREGVVFDQATSVAPLTLPAHASLFTGLFPPGHGVHDNAGQALDAAHTTLAEMLRTQGFRTGASVGSAVLHADRGLTQGFESYRSGLSLDRTGKESRQRRADEVVDDAIRWLDDVGRDRFFLWLHLYDPHLPYEPPEPFRSMYTDAYVGEIAFADAQVGRVLNALERQGRLENTIVVIAGDHGESLGEHGERDHGIFVYESTLRVPLIVRVPGGPRGRVAEVVRLVDVMPTLLDLLSVSAPQMDGVTLAGLMDGRVRHLGLEAYSESMYPERFGWSPLRALREDRFKVIEAPRPELYDLERDPFETRNLYEERRPLADALLRRLAVLTARKGSVDPPDKVLEPPALVKERLAALGYVAGGSFTSAHPRTDQPDPKDCVRSLDSCPAVTRPWRSPR